MKIIQAATKEQMSKLAANILIDCVKNKPDAVLGLATGGTPEETYRMFRQNVKEKRVELSRMRTFNLDEYEGLGPNHPMSYHAYMKQHLFDPLQLRPSQCFLPKGDALNLEEEAQQYEELIQKYGGIDLQLLGIGENGHIAFNEPGTPFTSRTHVVELTPNTRDINSRFFDKKEQVPYRAITMGLATIMEARKILLLANGERKQKAMTRFIEGEIAEDAPASILRKHRDVTIIADPPALTGINPDKITEVY